MLVRDKLVHHVDGAVESVLLLLDTEMLTVEEMGMLNTIQQDLRDVSTKCLNLVKAIQERKKGAASQFSGLYDGPKFAWADHDARAKRKKDIAKLKELRRQLAELESEMGE